MAPHAVSDADIIGDEVLRKDITAEDPHDPISREKVPKSKPIYELEDHPIDAPRSLKVSDTLHLVLIRRIED